MHRGLVLLTVALGALAVTSSAAAQVPKDTSRNWGSGQYYVRTAAGTACPAWTTTVDTPEYQESRCEVTPAPGASYACRRYYGVDDYRTYGESCTATAAEAQAGCASDGQSGLWGGSDRESACTVAAGTTKVDLQRCESAGSTEWTSQCTTGPVTMSEYQNSRRADASLTVKAGDAEVRCSEVGEYDDTYELENCQVGE